MAGKKKGRKHYYGKKGGTAEYKNEIKFDIFTTLEALRDYYRGKKSN